MLTDPIPDNRARNVERSSSQPVDEAVRTNGLRPGGWCRGRLAGVLAGWICMSSCVTTIEDAPMTDTSALLLDLEPVIIPFGDNTGANLPVDQYYRSAFMGLQDALAERDVVRARSLLTTHDRSDAPDWAQEQMAGFRNALRGLQWTERLTANARVSGPSPLPAIGVPLRLEFVADGMQGCGVRIAGSGAGRPRLGVFFEVLDTDAMGNQTTRQTAEILEVDQPIDLDAGDIWRAPFAIDLGAQSALERKIIVRAELLPGRVATDEGTVPVARSVLDEAVFTLYPRGIERIQADPLRVMRDAIRVGTPRFFPHQFLAARLMPKHRVEAALALQIDQLRLGDRTREVIAMSCLRQLAGAGGNGLTRREEWLSWWNLREQKR